MKTQWNVSNPFIQPSTTRTITNPALHRFLEQNPGIESVDDFIWHCHARGGEATFHAKCRELGLDPNELYTSRTAAIADWTEMEPEQSFFPEPVLAAVG